MEDGTYPHFDMTEFNEWQEEQKTGTEKTMKLIN